MSATNFWSNADVSQPIITELKALRAVVMPAEELARRIEDLFSLRELAIEANSPETLTEAEEEARKVQAELEKLELRTLLSGPHDARNCYFSIHAGAGGTESCDWAAMLLRMYLRYFEQAGYEATEVDRLAGEEAGLRSVSLHVVGPYAYGYLSAERG
ncbi:MAG: PCRF domain-containing protein, partial [Phycisphaerae bacterium]